MKNTFSFLYLFAFVGALLFTTGCVKGDFDEPPADGADPDLTANATIADLQGMHSTDEYETITDDWIIEAIVVADDESGNFYKTIVLQDATGGISLLINATGLYTDFTVGRKVFIKVKGLILGDYNGLIQMGGSTYPQDNGDLRLAGIEEILLNEYVFPGQRNIPLEPTVYTITQLSPNQNNTLIQLNDVEFSSSDRGVSFADGVNNIAQNLFLEDCNGASILVRTSGYATFASDLTPTGNGTFVGIMSSFGTDRQLLLRNSFDLDMDGALCDGGGGGGGGGGTGDGVVNENFDGQSSNDDIVIAGWSNIAEVGERKWIGKEFDGNMYAQASAYNDASQQMAAWLVTDGVVLDSPKKLNFESAMAFYSHDGLSVWASTDFSGDPLSATWTELDCTLAEQGDDEHAFIPSGDIDLSSYSGTIHIAFKYTGSSASNDTGTFRLDNIVISDL